MGVMGFGQGVVGHVRVEVLATTRAPVLRVDDVDVAWPTERHPRRITDVLKPVTSRGGKGLTQRWTELEIEHVVPRAALGSGSQDNLVVACRWCNSGKNVFRSFAEEHPVLLAHAFASLRETASTQSLARAFFCVLNRSRQCDKCDRGPDDVELTIRAGTRHGWRKAFMLGTRCYDCVA